MPGRHTDRHTRIPKTLLYFPRDYCETVVSLVRQTDTRRHLTWNFDNSDLINVCSCTFFPCPHTNAIISTERSRARCGAVRLCGSGVTNAPAAAVLWRRVSSSCVCVCLVSQERCPTVNAVICFRTQTRMTDLLG